MWLLIWQLHAILVPSVAADDPLVPLKRLVQILYVNYSHIAQLEALILSLAAAARQAPRKLAIPLLALFSETGTDSYMSPLPRSAAFSGPQPSINRLLAQLSAPAAARLWSIHLGEIHSLTGNRRGMSVLCESLLHFLKQLVVPEAGTMALYELCLKTYADILLPLLSAASLASPPKKAISLPLTLRLHASLLGVEQQCRSFLVNPILALGPALDRLTSSGLSSEVNYHPKLAQQMQQSAAVAAQVSDSEALPPYFLQSDLSVPQVLDACRDQLDIEGESVNDELHRALFFACLQRIEQISAYLSNNIIKDPPLVSFNALRDLTSQQEQRADSPCDRYTALSKSQRKQLRAIRAEVECIISFLFRDLESFCDCLAASFAPERHSRGLFCWQALAERLSLVSQYASQAQCLQLMHIVLHSLGCAHCFTASSFEDARTSSPHTSFAAISRTVLGHPTFFEIGALRASLAPAILQLLAEPMSRLTPKNIVAKASYKCFQQLVQTCSGAQVFALGIEQPELKAISLSSIPPALSAVHATLLDLISKQLSAQDPLAFP